MSSHSYSLQSVMGGVWTFPKMPFRHHSCCSNAEYFGLLKNGTNLVRNHDFLGFKCTLNFLTKLQVFLPTFPHNFFLLILCEYHSMHPNPPHFPVLYPCNHSRKENRKKSLRGSCGVTHCTLLSNQLHWPMFSTMSYWSGSRSPDH